ncbi:MAG: signal peptide peptidase SppA [Rikenellaceae bacterium]|nr:signal peptide peptidase SppA [Rikenellaceae bacterium]
MKFWKTFFACLLALVVGSTALLFVGGAIVGGLSALLTPAPTSQLRPQSVLQLDLGRVSDSPVQSPLDQIDPNTLELLPTQSTLQVIETISAATMDSNIAGIYLRLGEYTEVSAANIEEIRGALKEFRRSGKWIVAYDEVYSQVGYWLASVANRVYINPMGSLEWSGLASQAMFYKGLLDKLDVHPQIIRHGTFKAAVEPFMTDRMSEANRTQNQALASAMWSVLVAGIAEERGLTPDYLQRLADQLAIDSAEAATDYGFVDGLMYEDEVTQYIAGLLEDPSVLAQTSAPTPTTDGEVEMTIPEADGSTIEVAEGEETTPQDSVTQKTNSININIIPFADYCALKPNTANHISRNKVAVIYTEGEIVSGSGHQQVGDKTLIKKLRRARQDRNVKAVVLRINSPGGSALAAEQMWHEIELLRAEKPVIVSMGAVAASGGYYIAAPADVIFTNRLTITGSIGVFGLFFDMGDALKNHLGVTIDGVKTARNADIGSPYREMNTAERSYFQRSVDDVYVTFVNRVSAGRNLSYEQVDAIAEGRVWSGVDAMRIGLADEFGGLAAAINVAADRGGVAQDFRIVEITEELSTLMQLLSSATMSVREKVMRRELGVLYEPWSQMRALESKNGLRAEYLLTTPLTLRD